MRSTKSVFLALVVGLSLSVGQAFAAGKTLSPGLYDNETGSPLLPVISAAKKTLDIAIYSMSDLKVLGAIQQAVTRGVRVRVVKEAEPLGSDSCKVFASAVAASEELSCPAQRQLRKAIVAAGGQYVPFEKASLCPNPNSYCYLHGKLVVADGQAALISTGNFDATNLCDAAERPERCNRDFTYLTADPTTVRALEAIFEGDLTRRSYNLPAILKPVSNKLTVSPYSLAPMVAYIKSARKSLRIENQYLYEPHLAEAVVEVAKRGVKVDLLVSSVCAFAKPDQKKAEQTRDLFTAYDKAGVRSRLFTSSIKVKRHPGYLHAKAIVVDDATAWVGSTNGSPTAVSNNREFGIYVTDRASVRGLAQRFDADFTSAGAETWEESLACKKDVPYRQ